MNLLTNKQLTQISKQISLLRDGVRVLVPMAEYLARNPKFASNTVVASAIVKNGTLYMGGVDLPISLPPCRLYL